MGQKHQTSQEFRTSFPPRDIRKNPRGMYARVAHMMAQFVLKIGNIVPYHKESPNTRNGARLRSPSRIMANGNIIILYEDSNDHRSYIHNLSKGEIKA